MEESALKGFIDELVQAGCLESDQARSVINIAIEHGESVVLLLLRMQLIDAPELSRRAAAYCALAYAENGLGADLYEAVEGFNREFMLHRHVAIVREITCGIIRVYVADPFDNYLRHALRFSLGTQTSIAIATPDEIRSCVEELYPAQRQALPDNNPKAGTTHESLRDLSRNDPVVRRLSELLAAAVRQSASDLHLEPSEDAMTVRFRIDGVLSQHCCLDRKLGEQIVLRLKVLGGMNIAESRIPQDGSWQQVFDGLAFDMRIATSPTKRGEGVVLRLLRRGQQKAAVELENIHLSDHVVDALKNAISNRRGIILVTGPTGSGKTTTLHACLSRVNRVDTKILTVEDPIEYVAEGAQQVQVDESIGRSFASMLRAFLRQDPDVILVGEIRDEETARIALRAAMTGHLVLSSMHTNDALSAAARLVDLGIEPYLIRDALSLVVAQRLVRRICSECSAEGCSRCNESGYFGRVPIAEVATRADLESKLDYIKDPQQFKFVPCLSSATLNDDAQLKVQQGLTTVEEFQRVTVSQ